VTDLSLVGRTGDVFDLDQVEDFEAKGLRPEVDRNPKFEAKLVSACPNCLLSAPTVVSQPPPSATLSRYERLICRELVRDQLRPIPAYHHHILDVPVLLVRLKRKDHALLEDGTSPAREDRLLLMPPGPNTVPNKGSTIVPSVLTVRFNHEIKHVASPDPGPAPINCHPVDVTHNGVLAFLFSA